MTTREQLTGFVDKFIEALAANDPSRLPTTPNVRYTENCETIPLGKGIWRTATPFVNKRHFIEFADPSSGQVGYFGVVQEAGKPSILSLRLKVEGDRVSEIEVLVCRQPDQTGHPRVFAPDAMQAPKAIFHEAVPEPERCPACELQRIANLYLDGVISGNGEMIPVADGCIRIENGVQTVLTEARGGETGKLGVRAQVNTGVFRDIEGARERRFPILDVERGLAYVFFFWDHPGPVTGAPFPSRYAQPNSMPVAELFKIRNRTIVQIEAVLNVFTYGATSGWA
jgi:hypothetical protein